MFTSSTEREIRHFHVVVVQRRENKCIKKRGRVVNLLLFCRYRYRYRCVAVVVTQAPWELGENFGAISLSTLYPFKNVLGSYSNVSLSLVDGSHCLHFDKFHGTPPLRRGYVGFQR